MSDIVCGCCNGLCPEAFDGAETKADFEARIRADERSKIQAEHHKLLTDVIRAEEREACALLVDPKLCETHGDDCPHPGNTTQRKIAAAIRARGGGK